MVDVGDNREEIISTIIREATPESDVGPEAYGREVAQIVQVLANRAVLQGQTMSQALADGFDAYGMRETATSRDPARRERVDTIIDAVLAGNLPVQFPDATHYNANNTRYRGATELGAINDHVFWQDVSGPHDSRQLPPIAERLGVSPLIAALQGPVDILSGETRPRSVTLADNSQIDIPNSFALQAPRSGGSAGPSPIRSVPTQDIRVTDASEIARNAGTSSPGSALSVPSSSSSIPNIAAILDVVNRPQAPPKIQDTQGGRAVEAIRNPAVADVMFGFDSFGPAALTGSVPPELQPPVRSSRGASPARDFIAENTFGPVDVLGGGARSGSVTLPDGTVVKIPVSFAGVAPATKERVAAAVTPRAKPVQRPVPRKAVRPAPAPQATQRRVQQAAPASVIERQASKVGAQVKTTPEAKTPYFVQSSGDAGKGEVVTTWQTKDGGTITAVTTPDGRSRTVARTDSSGSANATSTVLCTYFMKRGWLDRRLWVADVRFSASLPLQWRRGYLRWAVPLVRRMQKGERWLEPVLWPIVRAWAGYAAWRMGQGRWSFLGWVVHQVLGRVSARLGVKA